MVLDEFVIAVKSVFDNKGTNQALLSIAKISVACLAIDKGLESITNKFADIAMTSKATGDNMEGIQQWLNAGASSAFTNLDKVKSGIQGLQQQLIQARTTGQIPVGFQMAGINVNSTPIKALEQLRKKISGMSESKGMFLAQQAGLDALYPLLKLNEKEFEKLSQIPVLSEKQLKGVFEATSELRKFKTNIVAIKDQFFSAFAPAMKEFIDVLNKGIVLLLPIISAGLHKIGVILESTIKALKEYKIIGAVVLAGIFKASGGFKILALAGKMFLGVLTMISKHPVIFTLSALALIAEDIFQFFKGNDSVIGVVFQKAQKFLEPFLEKIKALKGIIVNLVGSFKMIGEAIFNFFSKSFEKVFNIFDKVQSAFGNIKGFFGFNTDEKQENGTKNYQQSNIDKGFGSYSSVIPSGIINNNSAINNNSSHKNMSFGNIVVNVNGGNPAQMRGIGQDIQRQIQNATFSL